MALKPPFEPQNEGIKDDVQMMEVHRHWVEEVLRNGLNKRDAQWTENIAVGDKEFVLETKARLGQRPSLGKYQGEMVIMN